MPRRIAQQAIWAASAAANTEVVVAGTTEESHGAGGAIVIVHNPSAVTAIQVTPRVRFTDSGGVVRTAVLADTAAFSVAANTTSAKRVPSMVGVPDLLLRNVTALGAGQGFTAEVVIQFE